MTGETAKSLLEDMKGKKFNVDGKLETFERYHINLENDVVTITTSLDVRRCDINELSEHLKMYEKINKKISGSAIAALQPDAEDEMDSTDKKEIAIQDNKDTLDIFTRMPGANNIAAVEEALLSTIKKLQLGDKDAIPIAEALNGAANSIINLQKVRIETGRLIIDAKKLKL